MDELKIEEIEIKLLLEGIYQAHGWDLRDYAPASLKRRIRNCMDEERIETVSALQVRVLHDVSAMQRLLNSISVTVTSMFRDPGFYLAVRRKVVPLIRSNEFIRIWHAGCATGEEVYSMAILLVEEGLYERTRIYGTDMNEDSLRKARDGILPLGQMKDYTSNYIQAGGTRSFAEYYTALYDSAKLRTSLKENVVWAQHNLVTDASFNVFDIVVCRNVMIYFNDALQNHTHDLIYKSLHQGGVLGLGNRETTRYSLHDADYETLDAENRLFRRVR